MTRTISLGELAPTKAVCIGGGTGVPSSIKALVALGIEPSAVVSVADDGGSSGLLRTHTGQVPPGDLRKCLIALARDPQSPWVKAFRTRFEYANDHALGNLIITALQENTASLSESITLCEQLLDTRGHVYPASFESVLLMGTTQDGQKLLGQSTICKSETALAEVRLDPAHAEANPAAVTALLDADLLVFGPGSLFTSIIPNLLIPGIREAIHESKATTVFVCPLADIQGETWGLNAAELTDTLMAHGLEGRLDYVLVNRQEAPSTAGNITGYFSVIGSEEQPLPLPPQEHKPVLQPVVLTEETSSSIRERGVKVLAREMNDSEHPNWHDTQELAKAFASIIVDSRGL